MELVNSGIKDKQEESGRRKREWGEEEFLQQKGYCTAE